MYNAFLFFASLIVLCNGYNVGPKQCGKNEVLSCRKDCPPEKTCRNRGILFNCFHDGKDCTLKCVCKEGYIRNINGECIEEKRCDQCSREHEYFSCGNVCDSECSKLSSQNKTHCPMHYGKCTEKCYCEDGYARDASNNCIQIDMCNKKLPLQCNPNEVEVCSKVCPPEKTCKNRGRVYRCFDDKKPCTPKCVCKAGSVRNVIGECIEEKRCDQCSGDHEYYSCGRPCDNVCSTLSYQNKTHCPIMNIKCTEKCYCEDGYARDGNNKCVPIGMCPKSPPLKCNPNEVEVCSKDCPPEKTCKTRDIAYRCRDDGKPCAPKCVCKAGSVRNIKGECIEEKQCDQCSREHEYFSCGNTCDNECSKLVYQNKTHCPIHKGKCIERCYCEDGYARDVRNNCVPISQCPRRRKPCQLKGCGPNEEYACKKSCPPETCISLVAKFKCDSCEKCVKRCYCKPGYLRKDLKSPCMPIGQCLQQDSTGCKS